MCSASLHVHVRRAAREQAERAGSPTCQLGGCKANPATPSAPQTKPDPGSAKQPRGFSQASRGMTPQGFASFPTGRRAAEGAPSRTRRRLFPAGGKRRGAEGTWGKYAFGGLGLGFHHEPVGRPRAQGPAPGCPCEPADWSARPSSRAFGARAHFSGSRVLRGRPLLTKRERSLKTAFFFSLQDDREGNNPRLRVGGEPLEIKARRPCSRGNSRGGGRLGVDLRVKLAKGHGRREATWRLSRSHERVNPRETSLPKSAGPGGAFG